MLGSILVAVITILIAVILIAFFFYRKAGKLKLAYNDLAFRKSSQSVKYGKLTEQWIPFSAAFPHYPEQFRFLGNPIDGIVFDTDNEKIVFCEFKTNTSRLNEKQKKIKQIVKAGNVEWLEFNVK